MTAHPKEPAAPGGPQPRLHEVLLDDLREATRRRSFREDLRALVGFYLDEETREKWNAMGRFPRAFWLIPWLLKSLLLKLSPGRRLLLLASLILALGPRIQIARVNLSLHTSFPVWGYVLLLIVLMLELKDKLLARDEIAVARQVQLALLPRTHPTVPGWSIWSFTRPANDVGGDLVDYLDLGPRGTGVALGDVAGKGLGAALLMAKLQATLHALVPECASLVELGARLNGSLLRGGLDNRFATLFYMEIKPGSGQLRYLNAGHNPAFVVRPTSMEALSAGALPLGMLPEIPLNEGAIELSPGDLVVVYSDGLTEARNDREEEFGEARLREMLPAFRGLTVEEAGRRLIFAADRFMGDVRPHDDLSLVTLRREAG